MVGEFGSINRTGNSALTGGDLTLHLAGRTDWDHVVVSDANNMGLRPVYWDDGGNGTEVDVWQNTKSTNQEWTFQSP